MELCAQRFLRTLGALIMVALLLGGCGGGGGGFTVADSASTSATAANGAGSTGTNPVTPPIPGGTSGTPLPGGPTTPGASPTPGTNPAGKGTFAAHIVDETNAGLDGVAYTARPVVKKRVNGKIVWVAKKGGQKYEGQTQNGGNFELDNLGVGPDDNYLVGLSKAGRRGVKFVFGVDAEAPHVSIQATQPKGVGEDWVSWPKVLKLRVAAPWKDGHRVAELNWEASPNPGFTTYAVYRSETPGAGVAGTQVASLFSSTQTSYTQEPVDKQYYYQVYEQIYVPSNGTFWLVGTNEAQASFPTVTMNPAHGENGVPTKSPIQLTFSTASGVTVNHALLESKIKLTSVGDQTESLTWKPVWTKDANDKDVLTVTPDNPFKLQRRITVEVTGATDSNGSTITTLPIPSPTPYNYSQAFFQSATFRVTDGYTRTTFTQAASDNDFLNMVVDSTQNRLYAYYQSDLHNLSQLRVYKETDGTLLSQPASFSFEPWLIDFQGNLWGSESFSKGMFTVNLISQTTISLALSASSPYGITAVSPDGKTAYKVNANNEPACVHAYPKQAGIYTDINQTIGRLGNMPGGLVHPDSVTVDKQGNLYVSDSGRNKIIKYSSNGTFLIEWGQTDTSHLGCGSFTHLGKILADGNDDGYVYVLDGYGSTGLLIQKFKLNGEFVTQKPVPTGDLSFKDFAVDSSGSIFWIPTFKGAYDNQIIRFSPASNP